MAYLEIVHVIDLVLPYKILLFKTYLLKFVWGFFYRLKLQKKKKGASQLYMIISCFSERSFKF